MEKKEICDTCYYQERIPGKSYLDAKPGESVFECHRNPPTAIPLVLPTPQGIRIDIKAVHPPLPPNRPDFGCGEYRAKLEVA